MNTVTGVIVGILVVLAVVAGVLWYQNEQEKQNDTTIEIGF